MNEKILIIDFGSQYTQLIARRVRELNVYSEIVPYHKIPETDAKTKGIILSGSPFSVEDKNAPQIDFHAWMGKVPVLGICYGAQYMAKHTGGYVTPSEKREYGRAHLSRFQQNHPLFQNIPLGSQVWMSHGDTIQQLGDDMQIIGSTNDVEVAAFELKTEGPAPVYGIQFHPEVTHSADGKQLLNNFVHGICHCHDEWTPASFAEESIQKIKTKIGHDKVVLGLSGGVDSTVAAELIHRAIGDRLYCIFVDNGLLRKNEFEDVLESYLVMGLNVKGVDAKNEFYNALKNISDPELKRKAIGRTFIEVFDREAHTIQDVDWLGQGTIYPDVIESVSVHGPSVTIKSHHNVGGLPEKLHLKVIEPLRSLFKDEVRKVGRELNIPDNILQRHPFPGPGLGIRILGEITLEKVRILQEADAIFINGLKEHGLYDEVWQAATILLPVQTVGVMGDERTYENVVALRAVTSLDGMTADWCKLPYDFLGNISTLIINQVRGINRVVYDISTKPPSTIEWE
jgi:GMP synthase (glutamine-hydrolysing)